ncbi:MAG: ketoacyl-ACP synthase III [Phycisphaerales bacterium]|nr:ketoacyl-ACP synthase III [Phycisphaerales bacterium]
MKILGVGSAVPEGILTNHDLEQLMDTNDEWIVQRTGVRERRIMPPGQLRPTTTLSVEALRNALDDAQLKPTDLDLIVIGTVSSEMACPSTACLVAAEVGATPAAAMDVSAACCGYVYSLNMAESLVACGRYRRIAVLGCDIMTILQDYTDRGRNTCILFGDAAGCVIIGPSDDLSLGCMAQLMYADGSDWDLLYIPRKLTDLPDDVKPEDVKLGCLQMRGREVFKFAVSKFADIIAATLEKADVGIEEIAMVVAHQSNRRILDSARKRFGMPEEKMYVNIDYYGNSSSGSTGLCFDQVWRSGKVKRGDKVLFVAFGGGMTWASSLWQL